jgi:hypothetical protein
MHSQNDDVNLKSGSHQRVQPDGGRVKTMKIKINIPLAPVLLLAKALLAGSQLPAQVLNPGFELAGNTASGATNWTVTQAVGGPVYGVRTNSAPHSGTFHFEVHLASTGSGPVVEFMQSGVPVTGGTTYPFTFYANAQAGSAGYNAEWRVFWNAGGDTGYQAYAPGNNAYALISNSVVAPLTATSATVFFHFAGAAISSQSATIDLDDVSFASTNPADGGTSTTNRIPLTIISGTGIRWFASNSVTYQVQWASALNGTNTVWNNLGGGIVGAGATNRVFDPVDPSHKWFQVLALP